MATISTFIQARGKTIIALLMLVGTFLAGNIWNERGWQKKWVDHNSVEPPQETNAQTATRWIEQGRVITRDEAVKDVQAQAARSAAAAVGPSATVSQLHTEAIKLATRMDTTKHISDLATSVRSKTVGVDATVLADMFGDIAVKAKRYAGIADEHYTAGMTCKRIYDSVRESNNNPAAS